MSRASLLQTACLSAISCCRLLAELHSPTHASPMCYCSPSAAPPPRPSQLPARPPSKPAQQIGAPGQASRKPLRCAADGACAFACAIKYVHMCRVANEWLLPQSSPVILHALSTPASFQIDCSCFAVIHLIQCSSCSTLPPCVPSPPCYSS